MAEILLAIDAHSKVLICIGVLADILTYFPDENRVKDVFRRYCPPLLMLAFADVLIFANIVQLSAEVMLVKCAIFIYFFVLNWNRLGLNFFILGMALNNLVMGANGGQMPVANGPDILAMDRILMSENTQLNFLADYIYARGYYMSIGDCCMFVGVLVFAVYQSAVMIEYRLIRKNEIKK